MYKILNSSIKYLCLISERMCARNAHLAVQITGLNMCIWDLFPLYSLYGILLPVWFFVSLWCLGM